MQKKFKFTNAKLKSIKPHDKDSPSTDLELSDDSDVSGLKLLVGNPIVVGELFSHLFGIAFFPCLYELSNIYLRNFSKF